MKKNFKTNQKYFYVTLIIAILIISTGLILSIKINEKSKYFKKVFESSYIVSNKFISFFNLTKYTENNTTMNINLSGTNSADTINLQLQNYIDKNLIAVNLNYKNYDLSYLTQNGKYYLKSDSLLENIYELNENDFYNNFLKNFNNSAFIDNTTNLLKKAKNILNKSLDKKYVSKKSTTTLVGETEEKVTRYSYSLNKDSLRKLINNACQDEDIKNAITAALKANSKFKDINVTDIKTILEENIINGTFNIYVKNGKIKKVSIYLLDSAEIEYYVTDDYMKLTIKGEKTHNIFTVNYNLANKEATVTLAKNSSKVNEFLITLDDNLKISYEVYLDDKKLSGIITHRYTNDTKDAGIITITDNERIINISYSKETEENISPYDFSNAVQISTPTEKEITKITSAATDLMQSSFIKNIIELYKGLKDA